MEDKVFSFEKGVSRLNKKKCRVFKKLVKKWIKITLRYPYCYPCREMRNDRYSFDDDFDAKESVFYMTSQYDGMVVEANDKVVVFQRAEKIQIFPIEFIISVDKIYNL